MSAEGRMRGTAGPRDPHVPGEDGLLPAERRVRDELGHLPLDFRAMWAISNLFRTSAAIRRHTLRNKGFLALSACNGVLATNQVLLNIVIPLWLVQETDAPQVLLAWLFGTNTVMAVLLQVAAARGVDSVDRSLRAARISAFFFVLSCGIVLVTHDTLGWVTIALVWLGHVTVTGAELFESAAHWGFMSELSDPDRRGEYQGAAHLGGTVGQRLGAGGVHLPRDGVGNRRLAADRGIVVLAATLGMRPSARAAERYLQRDTRPRRACLNPRVATPSQWLHGARPRTLPAAVAPVLAGTGVAAYVDAAVWWKAALALVVSLALQVAVNYANDYSDGIRGTDDSRVGPLRLVGSGTASPGAVKRAAFLAFGVASVAGLVLAVTTAWWLVAVGIVCMVAAWFYTGGANPYGYLGLGEVMVFVFFGLVAVVGTTYVQTETFECAALYAAIGIGALACAILVANNLRDIPTDTESGKRTLAVVLGDGRTRVLLRPARGRGAGRGRRARRHDDVVGAPGLMFLAPRRGHPDGPGHAKGPALVPVLAQTGLAELLLGAGVLAGLLLA